MIDFAINAAQTPLQLTERVAGIKNPRIKTVSVHLVLSAFRILCLH